MIVAHEHQSLVSEKAVSRTTSVKSRETPFAGSALSSPAYAGGPAVSLNGGHQHMHAQGKCAGCSITGGTCQSCGGGKQFEGLPKRGIIPSNTLVCLKRWTRCNEPYDSGSWSAKVTYHCPILRSGLIWPGTTEPTYIMIPDEYVGQDPWGKPQYRCRSAGAVRASLIDVDMVATSANRKIIYPSLKECHQGFRIILEPLLAEEFKPSGGGRPWGGRVKGPAPFAGSPCVAIMPATIPKLALQVPDASRQQQSAIQRG